MRAVVWEEVRTDSFYWSLHSSSNGEEESQGGDEEDSVDEEASEKEDQVEKREDSEENRIRMAIRKTTRMTLAPSMRKTARSTL